MRTVPIAALRPRTPPNSVCPTCFHYGVDMVRGYERFVCMRLKRFTDGSAYREISIPFETDDYTDPKRIAGDKCGRTFNHWRDRDGSHKPKN